MDRRWTARLALAAGTALLVPPVSAGLRSVALVGVGLGRCLRPGPRRGRAEHTPLGDPEDVTHRTRIRAARRRPPAGAAHIDYSGAVYGSLLAASVVVGAGTPGSFPRVELVVLLLGTGAVFWAAHVFSRVLGARLVGQPVSRGEVRRVCADERPIVEAAVPPAAAVAIGPLLGLGVRGTGWLALAVALAGQVGWATAAAVRAGASRRLILVAGAANLLLGSVIVVLKVTLQH